MSERYQREIEEILRQAGESTADGEPRENGGSPLLRRFSRVGRGIGNHIYLSPGRLMFTGVSLLLSAILVSVIVPGLVGPIVWLGLILFILAYVLFFARPSLRMEKRWRGRLIESQESWWDRFQRWLRR